MVLAFMEEKVTLPTGRTSTHQEIGVHILGWVTIGIPPSGGSRLGKMYYKYLKSNHL